MTSAKALKANDWLSMVQLSKGMLWARLRVRTEPPQHLSLKAAFCRVKTRILAFVPWFHSTEGAWGSSHPLRVDYVQLCCSHLCFLLKVMFDLRSEVKIQSRLPLMNWFGARELRVQANIRCLEYSIYFYPPLHPLVLAVTITTEVS